MTTYAQSAAPDNALLMWTNGRTIFVEFRSLHGKAPYIVSFAMSEGGLSKALALLRTHADSAGTPHIGNPFRSNLSPMHGKVGTELQRAQAEAVLRKRGLIP